MFFSSQIGACLSWLKATKKSVHNIYIWKKMLRYFSTYIYCTICTFDVFGSNAGKVAWKGKNYRGKEKSFISLGETEHAGVIKIIV